MTKSKQLSPKWANKLAAIFSLLSGVILYINLGRDALFDWDEGIYAELGSELIKSGNWFINTWNYSSWFEKPPGISWLSAIGQLITGHTPYGARLLMPLVSALTLYAIYLLGKKLKNHRVGLMSAGFLLGFNLFLARTRAVNTDMPLLLGTITTLYLIVAGHKPWKVALAITFSVWFKGLAGVLPLLIASPLFISKGKKYTLHTLYYTLLTVLPWHIFALIRYGREFLSPYLLEQVITRVTSPIEFHLESRWFYLQYLYENLGLGMVIVLTLALTYLTHSFIRTRKLETQHILIWWLMIPIAIFTIAKTRLFWYILPVYPAIALTLAYFLDSFATSKSSHRVLTILTIGIMAQGLRSAYFSVEPAKLTAVTPDRITVATELAKINSNTLAVLVPPSERMAEAILPHTQRISSSFRYGGMPSVVFYYDSPVLFFYNVDEFLEYWQTHQDIIAMIHTDDQDLISPFHIHTTTDKYLGITREDL